MKKIFKKILDIILLPFTIVAVIFAGIAIISNFLFTPKLFQKFAELFPIIFSKKLLIILFFILIVLAGGIFAWQYFEVQKEGPKDKTADWKECQNIKYGYEIKYPTDWRVWDPGAPEARLTSCGESVPHSSYFLISFSPNIYSSADSQLRISVCNQDCLRGTIYERSQSLEDYFNRNPNLAGNPIIKESNIDNQRAVWLQDFPSPQISVFYNGAIFEIHGYNLTPLFFNQMISTFRFTEEEKAKQDETANWKTYKNDEYGFEMKYPDWYYIEISGERIIFKDSKDINNLQLSLMIVNLGLNEITALYTSDVRETFIGGKKAKYFSVTIQDQIKKNHYIQLNGQHSLIIETILNEQLFSEQSGLLNTMLSTFRFLE